MSRQPTKSPQFQEALGWQWRTLDVCIDGALDRGNPDYAPYMAKETTTGRKRACRNSWIAPHNFEGFFLNMGDMLVKSGDWRSAEKIYANAKLSKTYATWPYRSVLEERIARAQDNVARLNATDGPSKARMMIDSDYACMACHQH
jgi:hypothetical protein